MFTFYTHYQRYALAILLYGTLFQSCHPNLQNAKEEATSDASRSLIDTPSLQRSNLRLQRITEETTPDASRSLIDTPSLQRSNLRLQRAIEEATPDTSQSFVDTPLLQRITLWSQRAIEATTPDVSQTFVDTPALQRSNLRLQRIIEETTPDALQTFVDTPVLQRSNLRLQRAIEATTPDVSQVPRVVFQENISPSIPSPLSTTHFSVILPTSESSSSSSQASTITSLIPRVLFTNSPQQGCILPSHRSLTDQEVARLLCNLRHMHLMRGGMMPSEPIRRLVSSSISSITESIDYASPNNARISTAQPDSETTYYECDENEADHLQEEVYTGQRVMLHDDSSDLPVEASKMAALENSMKHELNRIERTLQAQISHQQEEIRKPMLEIQSKLQQRDQAHQELSSQLSCERMKRKAAEKSLDFYKKAYEQHLVTYQKERKKHQRDYDFILAENNWLKSRLKGLESTRQTTLSTKQVFRKSAPAMAFGKEEWQRYLGDIGEEVPPLPADIDAILYSSCPFWPNKKVKDTHLLVLIPSKVCGKPFTLTLLEELAKKPGQGGFGTAYRIYGKVVKSVLGDQAPPHSYWALVARHILPHSCLKTHEEQNSLIKNYARQTGLDYEQPSTLELATAILTHYVCSGERLYPSVTSYVRCQEWLLNLGPVTVGGFSSAGLAINTSIPFSSDGVTARIRFDLCYPDPYNLESPSSLGVA